MASQSWSLNRWQYLTRIWQLRYFWLSLVQMDLRTRYRRSFFGIGWSLLRPLAMSIVLCVVFGKLFNVPAAEYAPFLLVGLTIWQYLVETAVAGCDSFTLGAAYIRQQNVPLAIFPLRTALGAGLHGLIALGLAVFLTFYFKGFVHPGTVLLIFPGIVLLFFLGWFLAMLAGMFHCYFPDTRHIMEIGLQMMFYVTPILYRPDALRGRERFAWMIELNPMTHILEIIRGPVLDGHVPALQTYAIGLAFVGAIGLLAVACLRKLEKSLVFWL